MQQVANPLWSVSGSSSAAPQSGQITSTKVNSAPVGFVSAIIFPKNELCSARYPRRTVNDFHRRCPSVIDSGIFMNCASNAIGSFG